VLDPAQLAQVRGRAPDLGRWLTHVISIDVRGGAREPRSSSVDGRFSTVVGRAGRTRRESHITLQGRPEVAGNAVGVNFPTATIRYVRINTTGQAGWFAGQLGELEVYS
jgi:hypothetical protein